MSEYSEILSKTKEYYLKLTPVRCPELNNTYVYFTRSGFNHLLRKGQIPRIKSDQIRRFKLLNKVSNAISSGNLIEHRILGKIDYWTLLKGNTKVIVRKGERGSLHFFSIM